MFGLNEYYDDLLLEAKSPEEIKKILLYKYVQGKNVPEIVFDKIFNADPTKKKSYTNWMLMRWGSEQQWIQKLIAEDRLNSFFHYFQSRQNNGVNLTDIGTVKEAIQMLPDFDPVLSKNHKGGPEDNFEIVYDSPEWKIAVPHSYEASKKLGQGCRWCTAGAFGDGIGYYNRYSSAGPLWINFDCRKSEIAPMDKKEYPYKRYQFLFEWQNYHGELMDSNDSRISFDSIDMPESVIDFYGEQNEKYRDMIENGPDDEEDDESAWEDYGQERWDNRVTIKGWDNFHGHGLVFLEPENVNHPVFGEYDYYQIYDTEDDSDPICWNRFSKNTDESIVDLFGGEDGAPCALLRDTDNKLIMCYKRDSGYWDRMEINEGYYKVSEDGNYIFFWEDDNQLFFYNPDYERENVDVIQNLPADISNIIYNGYYLGENKYETYGVTFEIVFDNGFHALYNLSDNGCEEIIRYDKPLENKFEVLEDENGDEYIRGVYGIHYLEPNIGPDAEVRKSYDFEDEITDDVYIISSYFNWTQKYNVYDRRSGKIVLKEWASKVDGVDDEEGNIVILASYGGNRYTLPEKTILYNITNGKELKFTDVIHGWGVFIGYLRSSSDARVAASSVVKAVVVDTSLNIIASFSNVMCLLKNYKMVVRDENSIYKVFDYSNKKFMSQQFIAFGNEVGENIQQNSTVMHSPYLCIRSVDRNLYFYDYVNDRIISSIERAPKKLQISGHDVFIILAKGGEANMIVDGKLVLSQNVERILLPSWPIPPAIPFIENTRLYFYDITDGSIKPSKNGFNTKYIDIYDIRNGPCSYIIGLSKIAGFDDNAEFTYNFKTNSIIAADPKIKEFVFKNIVGDSEQISENFNKFLNRINNVKF